MSLAGSPLDPLHVAAMTKLTDGFVLGDRIIAAAKGGPERPELSEMIEMAANDADLAVAVLARLAGFISGRSDDEQDSAARAAGIPASLASAARVTETGIILP